MRISLNLCAGLNRLGEHYRINDYRYIRKHPEEIACIIGKPHVLNKIAWVNPILFGAAVYSHPLDDPQLVERLPIKKILVPGPWMEEMFVPYWGKAVEVWPVGINTELWWPTAIEKKTIDVLLYDKVRWEHDCYNETLIEPIRMTLRKKRISFEEIRYGFYREEDFLSALARCRSLIFLCEHETQGLAYQQALSCGIPILAWDRGGFWQDPAYYPEKVKFGPVTSVPYWDERCGIKFKDITEFPEKLEEFLDRLRSYHFKPRDYIMENLTLEKCALRYVKIVQEVMRNIN
jgi:hypothetical protein